eukprot:TRINITY_DN33551_c0_g1_i1.p1 TRINITY_DN33551_c0_g1~~TRINITY_DN33551_c0_g1_i1.p1  ORF type:complete len:655 (+),score=140.67 TRINITY_DN33551_c0_g1_i1:275-1966(+)
MKVLSDNDPNWPQTTGRVEASSGLAHGSVHLDTHGHDATDSDAVVSASRPRVSSIGSDEGHSAARTVPLVPLAARHVRAVEALKTKKVTSRTTGEQVLRAARTDIHAFADGVAARIRERFAGESTSAFAKVGTAIADAARGTGGGSAFGEKLARMFSRTFLNTIDTTAKVSPQGWTFVITGDIGDMWLRDSAAQVEHYVECCANSSDAVVRVATSLVHEHAFLVLQDPYANSFHDPPRWDDRRSGLRRGGYVATGNYELDSFCYTVRLAHTLWRATGGDAVDHFDEMFHAAALLMMTVWRKEQTHHETSTYRYEELRMHGGLENSATRGGIGMTWQAFRPSDDPCQYHYNVPGNMMATVALRQLAEIAESVYGDSAMARDARALQQEIEEGIERYGTVQDRELGRVYAYEVDGHGQHVLMDDANVPSLLSIPFIGYRPRDANAAAATRKLVLSSRNPYFFSGRHVTGIGSPHTPRNYVWHMSLIMQGLTSTDPEEVARLLAMVVHSDAGTDLMHEGVDVNSPQRFTRAWFAWANSLFGMWVMRMVRDNTLPVAELVAAGTAHA